MLEAKEEDRMGWNGESQKSDSSPVANSNATTPRVSQQLPLTAAARPSNTNITMEVAVSTFSDSDTKPSRESFSTHLLSHQSSPSTVPSSAGKAATSMSILKQGHQHPSEEQDSKTASTTRKKRKASFKEGQSTGRWTEEEHQTFLQGLERYGREWKKVASLIPTRTSAQVRSHAQKYFAKAQQQSHNQHHHHDESLLSSGSSSPVVALERMPPSVQANVKRILRDPGTVQAEVEHTLSQLQERYRQLQIRLQKMERNTGNHHDDNSTLSSLQNEELIALSVLHSGLSAEGSHSSGSSDEEEDDSPQQNL